MDNYLPAVLLCRRDMKRALGSKHNTVLWEGHINCILLLVCCLLLIVFLFVPSLPRIVIPRIGRTACWCKDEGTDKFHQFTVQNISIHIQHFSTWHRPHVQRLNFSLMLSGWSYACHLFIYSSINNNFHPPTFINYSPYSYFGFETILRYEKLWNLNLILRPFFLGGTIMFIVFIVLPRHILMLILFFIWLRCNAYHRYH